MSVSLLTLALCIFSFLVHSQSGPASDRNPVPVGGPLPSSELGQPQQPYNGKFKNGQEHPARPG